jgi:hypothetical protein
MKRNPPTRVVEEPARRDLYRQTGGHAVRYSSGDRRAAPVIDEYAGAVHPIAARSHAGLVRALAWIAVSGLTFASSIAYGGDHLRLAPELSFTDDSSENFPIRGDHLDEGESALGQATVMFFGTAHCWNTNREAERLVTLYPKYQDRMRFLVVDVDHPSPNQRRLLQTYYRGSIPTLVIVARDGTVLYAKAGETARQRGDVSTLDSLLSSAVGN